MIRTMKEILDLIENDDPQQQKQIASVVASESVWFAFIEARPELRRAVTLNKHLPDSVLRKLARDDDRLIRFDVAMKRRLPMELFALLASDTDEGVRHRIAFNAKTPREIIQRLAEDPSPLVSAEARRRLAQKG